MSIPAGIGLLIFGDPFWRGQGLQALAWSGIDAVIALLRQRASHKRRDAEPHGPEVVVREARNKRLLLWITPGVEVLHVAGGFVLAYTLGAQNQFTCGNGWSIVLLNGLQ